MPDGQGELTGSQVHGTKMEGTSRCSRYILHSLKCDLEVKTGQVQQFLQVWSGLQWAGKSPILQ
jgi:hypothetical protein